MVYRPWCIFGIFPPQPTRPVRLSSRCSTGTTTTTSGGGGGSGCGSTNSSSIVVTSERRTDEEMLPWVDDDCWSLQYLLTSSRCPGMMTSGAAVECGSRPVMTLNDPTLRLPITTHTQTILTVIFHKIEFTNFLFFFLQRLLHVCLLHSLNTGYTIVSTWKS